MLLAKDFRRIARGALSGKWLLAVVTCFVASLLGGSILCYSGGGGAGGASSASSGAAGSNAAASVPTEAWALLGVVSVIATIVLIATIIIGGTVSLGYAKFNLGLVDGKEVRFGDLFSQFNRFGDGFVMRLLTTIFITLWTMLFIVPGIIASFSYAMTPYILYENPGMSANEAIRASKQMMKGRKWRLFCLNCSFIGWAILGLLTLGLGFLFVQPYIEASGAAFYRAAKAEMAGADNLYGQYSAQ